MKRIFENSLLVEVYDETKDGFRNVELRLVELNRRRPEVVGVRIKPEDLNAYKPYVLQIIPELIAWENIREGKSKDGKPYRFVNFGLDRVRLPTLAKAA